MSSPFEFDKEFMSIRAILIPELFIPFEKECRFD